MASMAATPAPQRGQFKRPRGQQQGPRRGGPPRRPHGQRPGQVASTSKARDAAPQASSPGAGTDEDIDKPSSSKTIAEAEADVPIFERTSLVLASNPLPPLSSLGATLARFTNLHRLDMSDMQPGQADDDDDDEAGSSRRLHSLSFLRDAQREAEREVRRARKARRKEGKARQDDDDDEERKTLAQTLTWLNLSSNPTLGEVQEKRSSPTSEDVLSPLSSLTSLRVLNLSSCSLLTPPPRSALLPLSESLCALVLSHNRLTTQALQEALPAMPNLNTLVLSHNKLTALPRALPGLLPKLAKLSVSHNDLGAGEQEAAEVDCDDDSDEEDGQAKDSAISNPLPDFTMNTSLREVRLSHNPRLRVLPAHIVSWGRGAAGGADEVDEAPAAEGSEGARPRARKHVRGLELLDVGHCGLSWETVQEALVSSAAPASGIKNLTLAGNADVEDEDDYKGAIRRALPGLVVLDGQRVVERGRKKETSAEQGKESADANATDGEDIVAASGAAAEQERPDKKRKRGSRGGSSAKGTAEEEDVAADVASDDEAEGSSKGKKEKATKSQSSDSQPEPPKLTAPRSGKRAKRGGKEKKQAKDRGEGEGDKEDEDWLAHTRAKAVAAAHGGEEEDDEVDDGPSKRKKAKKEGKGKDKDKQAKETKRAEKQKKKDQKDNKESAPRRAWDEVVPSGTAADGAATEQAATKSAPPTSTAVAGVVEVKKKHAQRQQQADRPATLGSGSSWLSGASGEGTGLGDGWGTGQSAWD